MAARKVLHCIMPNVRYGPNAGFPPKGGVVLGYKCGHKNVESVKLKARKDVSNIEQAVYRRIQSDGR